MLEIAHAGNTFGASSCTLTVNAHSLKAGVHRLPAKHSLCPHATPPFALPDLNVVAIALRVFTKSRMTDSAICIRVQISDASKVMCIRLFNQRNIADLGKLIH